MHAGGGHMHIYWDVHLALKSANFSISWSACCIQIQDLKTSTSTSIVQKIILTAIHTMTKLFVSLCSAQDGESTDINCLLFWAHFKNGKIKIKRQVYNKEIFTDFWYF